MKTKRKINLKRGSTDLPRAACSQTYVRRASPTFFLRKKESVLKTKVNCASNAVRVA